MANQEACQVYIEQQIKEGLEEGKNPHAIGKEVSSWVGKLFETCISANSIRMRATRMKESCTNVQPPPTTLISVQNSDNQVPESQHGGKREGAGPPLKYEKVTEPPKPFTNAIHIAIFVISHLERIAFDDPKRDEALGKVSDWIEQNL